MKKFNVFLTMILLVVSGNVFAQEKQVKKPAQCTPEQCLEMQVKHMEQTLCLDDATSAKFVPLYKEYMQAIKGCCSKPDVNQKKADRTDEQIIQGMKDRFAAQKKMLETKEKYFAQFQKFLNARQLEKVFAPRHEMMPKRMRNAQPGVPQKPGKPCDKGCCQMPK